MHMLCVLCMLKGNMFNVFILPKFNTNIGVKERTSGKRRTNKRAMATNIT